MSRGRKPYTDPPYKFTVCIPSSLVARLNILLYDERLKTAAYGSKSQLVAQLLKEWADKRTTPSGGQNA